VIQFKWSSLSFTQKSLDLAVLVVALATSIRILRLVSPAPTLNSEWERFLTMLFSATWTDLLFLAILLSGWNLCLSSLALYGSRRLARWCDDLIDVMRAVGLCTLTLAALAQVFEWEGIPRGLSLSFWLLASVSLFAWRWLKRVVLRKARM